MAAFCTQYEGFVALFNETFAKLGLALINQLYADNLLRRKQFDERIEGEWYLL